MILPRKPIFLGCEGESEMAYGQLLYDFARQSGLHVHLEVAGLMPGAGDPLARVKRARQEITKRLARRTKFSARYLIMDLDQVASHGLDLATIEASAAASDIKIIWQTPCHEALLLRHATAGGHKNPPTSQAALQELKKHWGGYQKPMTRAQLAKLIVLEQVVSAAQNDQPLEGLLREIGLIG